MRRALWKSRECLWLNRCYCGTLRYAWRRVPCGVQLDILAFAFSTHKMCLGVLGVSYCPSPEQMRSVDGHMCVCAGLFDEHRMVFNHLTPAYKQTTVLWKHPRRVFTYSHFAFHSKLPITCDTKKSCRQMTRLQSFPSCVTRSVPSVSYFSVCISDSFCIFLA